ncbi:hypothetical protein LJC74_04055 [Eubacteriales bacterium OttesenSCG-928-A19]|nr:hypothetical protein [Eubacteriales bacterium OttesenSCG-928-A19]
MQALERITKLHILAPPNMNLPDTDNMMPSISFGDLIFQVDKLETDRDLEELAERMKQVIATTLKNGKPVGGMFFGRGR